MPKAERRNHRRREYLVQFETADSGHDLEYPHLQGVAGVAVTTRRPTFMDAHGEHPGVLARAVAVDGLGSSPCTRAPSQRERRAAVRAVLEVILGEASLLEDGAYGSQVRLLGVV